MISKLRKIATVMAAAAAVMIGLAAVPATSGVLGTPKAAAACTQNVYEISVQQAAVHNAPSGSANVIAYYFQGNRIHGPHDGGVGPVWTYVYTYNGPGWLYNGYRTYIGCY